MLEKKQNLMDKMSDYINERVAPVLSAAFNRPTLNIVKNSMVNIMPVILIGSIFLLISLLGTTSMGTEKPILEFLAPYSDKISLLNSLTMGFMTLYFTVAVGQNYAEEYNLDKTSSSLVSLMSFIIINLNSVTDGKISIAAFGAQGLFPTMVTSILALKIYKFFVKRNIVIKMPDGVPPSVGMAFSSLIPYGVVSLFYWIVGTLFNVEVMVLMQKVMSPLFSGADNIFVFILFVFFTKILWAFGIHADFLFQGVLDPLKYTWIAENAAAKKAGDVLPHIWTTALERTCLWTGPVLGLLVILLFSNVKHLKAFSFATFPAAFFSIVEPVVFGLPLMLNPTLLIPFILSAVVGATLTYGSVLIGLVTPAFIELPWATPPVLIGFIASGDWKYIILTIINIVLGAIIYYPFVKAFEKQEKERIYAEERLGNEV